MQGLSNEKVSIIIIAHNEEGFIEECIDSLLRQTFDSFEIIIVDSCSTDRTASLAEKFVNLGRRIRLFSARDKGFSIARNLGIQYASNPYVFFIDADCIASKDWVEAGLKEFRNKRVVGVSGLTYYVSNEYRPSIRDRVVYNKNGSVYPTCNIAFEKKIVERTGGFRLRFNDGLEDWDMALRLMRYGKIIFSTEMQVFHQKKPRKISYALSNLRVRNTVRLIKDYYGNKNLPYFYKFKRIVLPLQFFIVFCPPLLFIYYMGARRVNIFRDINFIFFDYYRYVINRIIIWKTAFQEKIFLI
jgi:glycosyltransferase involved in cell wall biosynthesis